MRPRRLIVVLGLACAAALPAAGPAVADPPKSDPYPDISRYVKLDSEGFALDGQPGVWFSTPTGLNCGITDGPGYGSFGCTGPIPGAPAGTNQIAWFSGDGDPRFDITGHPVFSAGVPQRVLPPGSYIDYQYSRCAVTPDNGVYCDGGKYPYATGRFLVTPTASWLGEQD
jgi:hypothetical protein